jgi:hypothetical protein|tara:strand:+ start:631 stop:903 length:273 start_codon:yes stop_codon:yes gene_type:complete
MNIYKCAFVGIKGKQLGEVINYDTLDGVSTLLWEEGIVHECKLNADNSELHELQIEVVEDTLDKLLKNYILDLHEYNELYQAKVDFIILI